MKHESQQPDSIIKRVQTNRELFLYLYLWASMVVSTCSFLFLMANYILLSDRISLGPTATLLFSISAVANTIVSILFLVTWQKIGYRTKAVTVILINVALGLVDFSISGLSGDARLLFMIATIFAVILFNWQTAVGVGSIAVLAHAITGFLIQQELFTPILVRLPAYNALWLQSIPSSLLFVSFAMLGTGIVLRNALHTLHQQQDLLDKVQKQNSSLDRIVNERTRVLTVMVEINRTLTSILSVDQLVIEVVDQIQHAFGYYYVQVYLMDKQEKFLMMVGGTGETGSVLLLGRHKVAVSRGLIGRAVREKRVVVTKDVSKDLDWVANPLLPETKSEIVLPIMKENKVIAVLDIQQNVTNGFSPEDELALTNITLQMSIAIQNAERYREAQNRAHRESVLNETTQKIQLAPDLESTLQTVVESIGRELRTPRTNAGLDLEALKEVVGERTS